MKQNLILDGNKLQWHTDRVNDWKNGKRIAPITIDCALTTKCSYRCVYCYGKMQRMDETDELSKDVIFSFLDDAAEIGVKAISFVSDGESTCNKNLYDAILRGRQNKLDIALGTNGFLLKDDKLEEILPALTYLRFNISAGERDRYAHIHGCNTKCFDKVCATIKKAVEIKKRANLAVTIGMQMVLLPELKDQIMPLTKLGASLGVDYLVIKHCSDDENSTLGVDYTKYEELTAELQKAEQYSSNDYQVSVKWSKILSNGLRSYKSCYGPPFILQMSGSGLVAPCGMLFNDKYKKFHIGNIKETSFKTLWESERYWDIMNELSSCRFNAHTDCGTLCLQHKVNETLWSIKHEDLDLIKPSDIEPQHINFI